MHSCVCVKLNNIEIDRKKDKISLHQSPSIPLPSLLKENINPQLVWSETDLYVGTYVHMNVYYMASHCMCVTSILDFSYLYASIFLILLGAKIYGTMLI